MTEHDRTIRLAATALSEPLSASEAQVLDAHLSGCASCRREHAALATDHGRLRVLVAPRPMSASSRAEILAAAGRSQGPSLAYLLVAAALTLLLVGAFALWAGSRRAPALPAGFEGSWTATNCATYFVGGEAPSDLTIDCERWGDGATIGLDIGPGEPATVELSVDGRRTCSGSGTLNTTPPSPGDGTFLYVAILGPSCPPVEFGDDAASHLYLEPSGERIWFDDDGDGWGLSWIRPR